MIHRDVAVVALYQDGKVLLQDRRSISKVGEKWGLFGGGIEEGETPEQAVRREVREELDMRLGELASLGRFTYEDAGFHADIWAFAAPCPPVESLQLHEGDGFELVPFAEARGRLFGSDPQILAALEQWL